jgi:hypothetical protein
MAKKTEAAPKPRQPRLHPALEPDRIPEIDGAARDYVKARDSRMALTKIECQKKDALMELIHKHRSKLKAFDGTVKYETADDQVVILTEREELKVKRKGAENEET